MTKNLRVALIGYGYWGEILLNTLQKLSTIDVIVVCDINKKKVNKLHLTNSNIQTTTKFLDIIYRNDIDAVIISTPPHTHYEIAKKALSSNKHVLVEKPITQKRTQARILNNLADKKKLVLMVDYTYLYAPEVRVAKKMIDSGVLGDIRFFELTSAGPKQYKDYANVIWDFAPHDVSILHYLQGIPVKLHAENYSYLSKDRTDVSSLGFKFANGCNALIYLSWLSPVKIRKILIIGTKKSLFIEQCGIKGKIYMYQNDCYFRNSKQFKLYAHQIKNTKSLSGLPYSEPLKNVIHEFVKAITKQTQPLSNGRMALDIVNTIEQASKVSPSYKNLI